MFGGTSCLSVRGLAWRDLCIILFFKQTAKPFLIIDIKVIGLRFLIGPFDLPSFWITVNTSCLISFGCFPADISGNDGRSLLNCFWEIICN